MGPSRNLAFSTIRPSEPCVTFGPPRARSGARSLGPAAQGLASSAPPRSASAAKSQDLARRICIEASVRPRPALMTALDRERGPTAARRSRLRVFDLERLSHQVVDE